MTDSLGRKAQLPRRHSSVRAMWAPFSHYFLDHGDNIVSQSSSLFSIAYDKKHFDRKQLRKERLVLCYTSWSRLSLGEVRAGTQGHSVKAGTEAETMEEHCLLGAPPHAPAMACSQPASLHTLGSPVQGWHCPPQAGLSHIYH